MTLRGTYSYNDYIREVFVVKSLTVRIDEEMHKEIRVRLAEEGKTFQDLVVGFLQDWLKLKEVADDGE